MAGKIVADIIEASGSQISLNVGNVTVFTASSVGSTLALVAGNVSFPSITSSGDINTGLYFPAADTIGFVEGGTEVVRINSSGNMGIGTDTQPSESQARQTLATSSNTYLQFARTATTIGGSLIGTSGENFIVQTYTGAVGSETYTERARISSIGLLVAATEDPSSSVSGVRITNPSGSPGTSRWSCGGTVSNKNLIAFCNGNGDVGTISVSSSATTYSTSSDYRLKNTIAPMTGALAKVALLKPCTYKWNVDGSDGQGFIAHEIDEVVPGCVTGEKDAVDADGNPQYQGIDTSFLVATLTAAIQELKAIVDAQAVEIAALKV